MWDIYLRVGSMYNVSSDMIYMFREEIYKNYMKYKFTILKSDGKLHIFNNELKDIKGKFEIVKFIKEPFVWYKPFRKRKIVEVLIRCISKIEE